MKKLTCRFCYFIAGLCLVVLPFNIQAENGTENQPQEQERVPVGQRSLSPYENLEIQKSRAERSLEVESEGISKNSNANIDSEESSNDELIARKTYYTSHEGVFHRPIAVTAFGDNVTLEDGSVWHVREKDRHKTLDWLLGDSILILPNHSWFSSYKFILLNQNTGKKVSVNMILGPIYNGIYTHWIVAIDYNTKKIWLEDGSVWDISGFDKSILNKWLINDTVVIGINDALFSSKINILINVNVLTYVAAVCLN
mgnify:CR=1 FL=1